MFRQIITPTKENHIIELPAEYYGLMVEVIIHPLSQVEEEDTKDMDAFYHSINLDMTGYKFDRDDTNGR